MQAILLFIGSKPELVAQYRSAQLDLVKVLHCNLARNSDDFDLLRASLRISTVLHGKQQVSDRTRIRLNKALHAATWPWVTE